MCRAEEPSRAVFKALIPTLTMRWMGARPGAIPRLVQHARILAGQFLLLVAPLPHLEANFRAAVQHACVKVPDRAEYRAAIAQVRVRER